MTISLLKIPSFSEEQNLENRLGKALEYFQKRSPVIFVSQHYQYWDRHGFVQQSLAKELVKAGIKVEWYDGCHWKRQSMTKTWDSPYLKLSQLPCLPLRRIPWIDSLNPWVQTRFLKKRVNFKNAPFLWVQSGLDERVVNELPYVDVFSVFDDPYLHSPSGVLSSKAKLITTQNVFAQNLFEPEQGSKVISLLPPVEMEPKLFEEDINFEFPSSFPKKIMGYIGSFFSDGFDLVLFENFIKTMPDWGFVLCGRTDSFGMRKVEYWSQYKNFFYVPWVPRKKVGSLWKKLNLNLMLYRPAPNTDGAFPVKFLEALFYRVPSLTTSVPKTSALEGVIPRLTFPDDLKMEATKLALSKDQPMDELFRKFSFAMDPKMHLIQVAEFTQQRDH